MAGRSVYPRIIGQQCDNLLLMIEVDEKNSRKVKNSLRPPVIFPPTNTQSLINHTGPWFEYTGPPEFVDQILADAVELDIYGVRIVKK